MTPSPRTPDQRPGQALTRGPVPRFAALDSCFCWDEGESTRHGKPSGFSISDGQMDIILGNYSR